MASDSLLLPSPSSSFPPNSLPGAKPEQPSAGFENPCRLSRSRSCFPHLARASRSVLSIIWKSRKKSFSNEQDSPEKATLSSKSDDDDVATSQSHLIHLDEPKVLASTKGSSDHGGKSVADEEENASRTPGVIARLMGLDCIPTSDISEPHLTPFNGSDTLEDEKNQNEGFEMHINDSAYCVNVRGGIYSVRPEWKSQKMPISLIQRFQIETLPPRSPKTISIVNDKLLSPVKNLGFISSKNAAHIIEVATKILESELHSRSMHGVQSLKSPMNPSKVHDSYAIIAIPKKISMFTESSEKIAERGSSGSLTGQTLKRSPKGSRECTLSKSYQKSDKAHPSCGKSEGKPISVATQTKAIYQKRIKRNVNDPLVLKGKEGYSFGKPSKSLLNDKKNNQHKRVPTIAGTSVPRENNQKKNQASADKKLALSSLISGQQGLKNLPKDASSENNKILCNLPGDARVGCIKKGHDFADPEKDGMASGPKNFPRKKRLVEHNSSIRCRSNYVIPIGKHGKQTQHNVVMDEHSRWHDDNTQNCRDVVSFTFTSPLRKPMSGSQACNLEVKSLDKKEYSNYPCEAAVGLDNGVLPYNKPNVIKGDNLGILLERKLQELTSGAQSPYRRIVKGGNALRYTSNLDGSAYAFNVKSSATAQNNTELLFTSFNDDLSGNLDSGSFTSDQAECMSHKLEEPNRVEHHSSNVDEESEYQDDGSHGKIGFHSSCFKLIIFLSIGAIYYTFAGSKIGASSSCMQVEDMVDWNCMNKALAMEPEEFSHADASSMHGAVMPETSIGHSNLCRQEMDKLEETRTCTTCDEEEKSHRIRRKLLFDSVNECLDFKCSHYFRARSSSLMRGAAIATKELAEEVYKEITGWRSIGDWMVDELVHKDMSTHLGSWSCFEMEESEVGVEIESAVLSSLLNEIVADFP
ncbi:hypothetical protein Cni_G03397 [Canna indica]|uniref:DUF4378 domain-containing protein n=1 Tax=Canna indica TaxID=4628 RepID=A0AAQ3JRJ2_9LILI|nr:hypothetical protein Cni_G03397 [Canna indica]